MLTELRKYRMGLAIAHQFLHQLTPEIRHAVLGNVGTFISFVGPEDASYVVREFQTVFEQEDVISLENYRIYLNLLIDGMPSLPFSARTLKSSELAQWAGVHPFKMLLQFRRKLISAFRVRNQKERLR